MITLSDVALACGMCVVTAYGVLVGAAGWVKFRNARRRAEAAARDDIGEGPPADRPSPSPQPA